MAGNLWDAPPPPPLDVPDGEKPKRHKWIKLRIHVYLCRTCGTKKETDPESFFTRYTTPDGHTRREKFTPPCVFGPKTEEYLAAHADEIAVHDDPTKPHAYRSWSDVNKNCALCGLLLDDTCSAHTNRSPGV